MKRIYVTDFHAAHLIQGHERCGTLHGHTYKLRVEVDLPYTVWLDFGHLKGVVEGVVEDYDHKVIGVTEYNSKTMSTINSTGVSKKERITLFIEGMTAERLALEIKNKITTDLKPLIEHPHCFDVVVELWETPRFGVRTDG